MTLFDATEEYGTVRRLAEHLSQALGRKVFETAVSKWRKGRAPVPVDCADLISAYFDGRVTVQELLYPRGIAPGARMCPTCPRQAA